MKNIIQIIIFKDPKYRLIVHLNIGQCLKKELTLFFIAFYMITFDLFWIVPPRIKTTFADLRKPR